MCNLCVWVDKWVALLAMSSVTPDCTQGSFLAKFRGLNRVPDIESRSEAWKSLYYIAVAWIIKIPGIGKQCNGNVIEVASGSEECAPLLTICILFYLE